MWYLQVERWQPGTLPSTVNLSVDTFTTLPCQAVSKIIGIHYLVVRLEGAFFAGSSGILRYCHTITKFRDDIRLIITA